MKLYIHPINPHFAATHADDYFKGWQYGIWQHPYPAPEPALYAIQSQSLAAAQDAKAQGEAASSHLADVPVVGDWVKLPAGVEPHAPKAAAPMQEALESSRPIKWPWSECSAHA